MHDNGNTGTGGDADLGSDTATINITAVNDAPVATITPTSYARPSRRPQPQEQRAVGQRRRRRLRLDDRDAVGDRGHADGDGRHQRRGRSAAAALSVTITGTVAQINALLNTDGTSTVSYIDNTDTPAASATLTLSITTTAIPARRRR